MNGLDKSVIIRANQLNKLAAQGGDLVLACSGINEGELELLSQAVCQFPWLINGIFSSFC